MSEESIINLSSPNFRDNRAVDFAAAVGTGLGLFFYETIIFPTPSFATPPSYGEIFQKIAVNVGAFAISALLFLAWKHPLRARWGWVPIAIVGLIILAKINDMIWEATIAEHEREPILEAFRYMEIYLYFVPAVILMGLSHYVGMLVRRRKFM